MSLATQLPRLRLWSGLVLFVYVVVHLLNHALGLVSLDVQDNVGQWVQAFWRTIPGTVALYGALAVHFISVLVGLWRRRTLRMRGTERAQIALGIAIPFLLVVHVMGTRYAAEAYGIHDGYAYVLLSTFVFSPVSGVLNAAGLVAAWIHGVIGLHMWLRVKSFYSVRVHQTGLVLATLVPSAALAGYLSAGRAIIPLSLDGDYMEGYYAGLNLVDDAVWAFIARDTDMVRNGLIGIVALLLVSRLVRHWARSRHRRIVVDYVDGPVTKQDVGPTLLEMSRMRAVPHASVCGGKGRCSTCRVRIVKAEGDIPEIDDDERRVLRRFKAGEDVRLACRLRPTGNMTVLRLMPAEATMRMVAEQGRFATGQEMVVTVMFADLRDFTRTSEKRLPFDVVYLINQFSGAMGREVEAQGGRIDKFLGDGLMVLFGLEDTPQQGARSALAAAAAMIDALDALNASLKGDLDEPLRMGIGLHSGPAVLGEIGYGAARALTAVGDTVNVASRLETATKAGDCIACISAATVDLAALDRPMVVPVPISVKGKDERISVYRVDHPRELEIIAVSV